MVGVFQYLNWKNGGDIVKKGIVNITTRDEGVYDDIIGNIVNYNNKVNWYFYGRKDNYVLFQINNYKFSICSMTIKVGSVSWYHTPSISLEVYDGEEWIQLYSEEKSDKLIEKNTQHKWYFNKSPMTSDIKLRSLDYQNNQNAHGIYLVSIDFGIYDYTRLFRIIKKTKHYLTIIVPFLICNNK